MLRFYDRINQLLSPDDIILFHFLNFFVKFYSIDSCKLFTTVWTVLSLIKKYLLFLEPSYKALSMENMSTVGYFDLLLHLDGAEAYHTVLYVNFLIGTVLCQI